jgi:subfamily B ATP-binding cassette protein MsbA
MHELIRLLRFAKPHVGRLLIATTLAGLVGVFEAGRTALLQPILDGLGAARPGGADALAATLGGSPFPSLARWLPAGGAYWAALLGLMLGVTVLRGAAEFAANFLLTAVGQSVIVSLRLRLFQHFLAQAAPFFSRHRASELASHIINDVEKAQAGVSQYLADLLREGFTLIFLLALAFFLSWKLTLAALLVTPFVALLTANFGRRLRRAARATQEGVAETLARAQETLAGHRVVQAYGAEAYEAERFQAASLELRRANLRTARALFLPSPIMDVIGVGAGAVVILYTRHLIEIGEMTVGSFATSLFALLRLYDPVRKLSQTYNSYNQVAAAAGRIFALLDERVEATDRPNAQPLREFSREIAFSDVRFTYPDASSAALNGANFVVTKGRTVALVGLSGSGKSTILNALLRFHELDAGAITIDGRDIRDVTCASLRNAVALVAQDVTLFDGSFAENVAYGRADADRQSVERAARAAFAHDFIMERGGYDAQIGEGGKRLSGGQRQRIAVARALLKDAPILLLDEATSALDAESERNVQEALANLMRGRTTLVIAHRLSTIQRADKIVVLDAGKVVEEGTHETLLAAGGLYRRLYDLQFADAPQAARPTTG